MTQKETIQGRARDVLDLIAGLENRGELITTRAIAAALGLPRQNIRTYLLTLREHGLITYEATERLTTAIHLTASGWQQSGVARQMPAGNSDAALPSYPILGEVAAGQPTLTGDHVEGYAALLRDVLDLHEGDFLLRVRGDSMTGIGIYPGDLVAIHPGADEPHPGEVTLVSVPGDDTATLKRWQRNNGTVTLRSENPLYGPMTFSVEDVQVQGCLIGHIGSGRTRRSPNGH